MRACVLALLFFLGSARLAFSQQPGALSGTVVDATSRRSLPGANVVLTGTAFGTVTGPQGEFRLEALPAGTYRLQVSTLGYLSATRSITLYPDSTISIEVPLTPSMIQVQPITVTATRGREGETPVTFSTLEREEIRDRHTTQDIPVLLSELPSMTTYSESGNNIGYTHLNIRGFDSRRVAVMVNGIPQNDPEDHNVYWLDMPDLAGSVEDIQVQRGAGSAFYGPPAIGGSVNIVTTTFWNERLIELSLGAGSYNTRKYAASFSSGLLGGHYAVHARLSKTLSDGYRDRAWVDFNSYFLGIMRTDETMTTQINIFGGPISDGLAYLGIPKSDVEDRTKRRANPIARPEEMEEFSQPHYELLHEWRISPTLTLNNALFFVSGNGYFDYDGSWAPYSYYRITPENGFPVQGDPDTLFIPDALIRAQVTNRQYGWLPRLTWRSEGNELIVGGEFRVHRSLHWGRLQYAGRLSVPVPYDYRYYEYSGAKDIISLYGHSLTPLGHSLGILAELQFVYNRYRLFDEKHIGTSFAVPYFFLNPRLGLNITLDSRWALYVSGAYTSREPRLKNLYDAAEASTPSAWGPVVPQFQVRPDGSYDFSQPLVTPESLFDLEWGVTFAADNIRLSGNAYWMEFTDEIVKTGQVDRFGQPVTGNAERTRHVGLELSGRFTPAPGLELVATGTISRNRFVRHTDFSTGAPLALDGNPIAGFPDLLGTVRLSYRRDAFMLAVTGRYVGRQNTDNFRNAANTVDPFFLSNFWGSYRFIDGLGDVDIEVRVQVNNLFDTLYAAYGEGEQYFVGAERNVFFSLVLHL
ncbi:MAG: TonB-dependent receptor [Bacteroidetes bacterium]|nr:TonB-dependent receptor [Bacteroidota bacterium]